MVARHGGEVADVACGGNAPAGGFSGGRSSARCRFRRQDAVVQSQTKESPGRSTRRTMQTGICANTASTEASASGRGSRNVVVGVRADHADDQPDELVQLVGGSVGIAADAVSVPVKVVRVIGADPDGAGQVRAVHVGDTSGRPVREVWACRGVRGRRVWRVWGSDGGPWLLGAGVRSTGRIGPVARRPGRWRSWASTCPWVGRGRPWRDR